LLYGLAVYNFLLGAKPSASLGARPSASHGQFHCTTSVKRICTLLPLTLALSLLERGTRRQAQDRLFSPSATITLSQSKGRNILQRAA